MNRKQWKELCKTDSRAAYFWYNKVKKFLNSKEFESDEPDKIAKMIVQYMDNRGIHVKSEFDKYRK